MSIDQVKYAVQCMNQDQNSVIQRQLMNSTFTTEAINNINAALNSIYLLVKK